MSSDHHAELMSQAIDVCALGIGVGQSPFGAVIATSDGTTVTAAHNEVRLRNDPTAHAEIVAIRRACQHLGSIDLSGHLIATTCEPCPMCASAIHWARLDAVVYGASIADARQAGFNELAAPIARLYEIGGSKVAVHGGILRDACTALFRQWTAGPRPEPY